MRLRAKFEFGVATYISCAMIFRLFREKLADRRASFLLIIFALDSPYQAFLLKISLEPSRHPTDAYG
jgi:hypothetical protein